MRPRLVIVLDCADPEALSGFWREAIGYRELGRDGPYIALVPADRGEGPKLILQGVAEPKTTKNRLHVDLHVEDLEAEVDRLLALGATRAVDAPIDECGCRWQVMADPEGNEFCVCHDDSRQA